MTDFRALPPDLPVVDDGAIAKVFYPVFPPDRNAAEVVAWLGERR
jgi:hypothetical protein